MNTNPLTKNTFTGVLKKMPTEIINGKVRYYLVFEKSFLSLNDFVGSNISIKHEGYECSECKKNTPIYSQGHCKPCFFTTPATAEWVMKPELSKAHLGIAHRDLAYEKKVQLQPHIVYLAVSSSVKVGITRKTQIPTRWIDQGAIKALPILELANRYEAGVVEVALKEHLSDKTAWQKMLKNDIENVDLQEVYKSVKKFIPSDYKPFLLQEKEVFIDYPVLSYPEKVSSLKLEKTPEVTGKLIGIKGQYLIFEGGKVFNIRNHEGFRAVISITHTS